MSRPQGTVISVSSNDKYTFTKPVRDEIVLVAGLGVDGDTHAGVHVRHRFRMRADPGQPNLRQVHLIRGELFGEVSAKGYTVEPGNLGENVTTGGLDLRRLPRGTILRFGQAGGDSAAVQEPPRDEVVAVAAPLADVLAAADAATLDDATARAVAAVRAALAREPGTDPRPAVIVTGLRNPCAQINGFQPGLLKEVIGHDEEGMLEWKAGVMAVVLRGGPIRPGDPVSVEPPPPPHAPLERV